MKTAANGQRIYTNNLHRCAAINSHRIRSTQDKGQCQGEQLNFPPTNFKFLRHVFAPSRHRIEYAWNNWIEKMKGKIWKMAFTRSEIKSPLNLNIKKLNCHFLPPPPPPHVISYYSSSWMASLRKLFGNCANTIYIKSSAFQIFLWHKKFFFTKHSACVVLCRSNMNKNFDKKGEQNTFLKHFPRKFNFCYKALRHAHT